MLADVTSSAPGVAGVGYASEVLGGEDAAGPAQHVPDLASVDEERLTQACIEIPATPRPRQKPQACRHLRGAKQSARRGG